MRTLLREPLLHFLLLGGLLFLWYGVQNQDTGEDPQRILVTQDSIDRLIDLWERKRGGLPSQSELSGLIQHQIREEVMYREALAMGLDKNDTVIHRRLAQKLEFITADIATQAEPSDAELSDYLKDHADRFSLPQRIIFTQVYFNTDKRGSKTQDTAQQLLQQLRMPEMSIDVGTLGDASMFGQQHQPSAALTQTEAARLFGNSFVRQLFELPVGSWQGPLSSGYGMHLVRISDKLPASMPELETVRDSLRQNWRADQRKKLNEAVYQKLQQRYDIVIENTTPLDQQ